MLIHVHPRAYLGGSYLQKQGAISERHCGEEADICDVGVKDTDRIIFQLQGSKTIQERVLVQKGGQPRL